TSAAGLAVAASLALPTHSAVADPKPDPKPDAHTARQSLSDLTAQVDALEQQYLKTQGDLTKAQTQLAVDRQLVQADQKTYSDARTATAQLAASAYKSSDGDQTIGTVLNAKNPADLLDQMSIVAAVSKDRSSALSVIINAAQQLKRNQDQQTAIVSTIAHTQD